MTEKLKDWEEPVAPTEQQHGRMVFPDTLPCEVEPGQIYFVQDEGPKWRRYLRNLWRALRGEGL